MGNRPWSTTPLGSPCANVQDLCDANCRLLCSFSNGCCCWSPVPCCSLLAGFAWRRHYGCSGLLDAILPIPSSQSTTSLLGLSNDCLATRADPQGLVWNTMRVRLKPTTRTLEYESVLRHKYVRYPQRFSTYWTRDVPDLGIRHFDNSTDNFSGIPRTGPAHWSHPTTPFLG